VGEVIRLPDDSELLQAEIDRRREAAQKADPLRKREQELRREQARMEKSSERLVTAYPEGLLTLSQLRQRMPPLQKQTQAVESELQSLLLPIQADADGHVHRPVLHPPFVPHLPIQSIKVEQSHIPAPAAGSARP
jgi:hypothetical protein